jgi:hypothetical protein
MKLSTRTASVTPAVVLHAWVTVVGWALGGCGPWSLPPIVRDTFAAAYGCPKDHVSVTGDGSTIPVEAAGCGHTAQYDCQGDASVNAIVCTPVQQVAKSAASNAWSCPEDRISVETNPVPAAPQPPADVAADPARLAIWQRQHAAPPSVRTFSASGCGQKAQVSCTWSVLAGDGVTSGDSVVWSCFSTPDGSALENLPHDVTKSRTGVVRTIDAGANVDAGAP